MASTAQIKAALKALFEASGEYGSVYTEDRERIEQPNPAAIIMWHDGGEAEPGPGRSETSTTNILVRILIPQPAVHGEVDMQVLSDTKVDKLRQLIRRNPTLDTGSGPLVQGSRALVWDCTYNKTDKRMEIEVKVAVTHEED